MPEPRLDANGYAIVDNPAPTPRERQAAIDGCEMAILLGRGAMSQDREDRLPKWARDLLAVEREKVATLERVIERSADVAWFDVGDVQIEVRRFGDGVRIVADQGPLEIELISSIGIAVRKRKP